MEPSQMWTAMGILSSATVLSPGMEHSRISKYSRINLNVTELLPEL